MWPATERRRVSNGTNHRVVLQVRDKKLLRVLDDFRFVDADQALTIAGFTSLSRTRARLALLVRGGHLGRFHVGDRKSTRLNSSHLVISYAVFCLKKQKSTNWRQLLRTAAKEVRGRSLAAKTRGRCTARPPGTSRVAV